jgi:tryptophan-rich sensory protein
VALTGITGYLTYIWGQVDPVAGWALAPYLGWLVSSYLNFGKWKIGINNRYRDLLPTSAPASDT